MPSFRYNYTIKDMEEGLARWPRRVLIPNPDNLNSIPRTHAVEGENRQPQSSSDLHRHTPLVALSQINNCKLSNIHMEQVGVKYLPQKYEDLNSMPRIHVLDLKKAKHDSVKTGRSPSLTGQSV